MSWRGVSSFVCPRAGSSPFIASNSQRATQHARLNGWSRKASEDEQGKNQKEPAESSKAKDEQAERPQGVSMFDEWTWLNPGRSFERRRVLETGAEMAQTSALGIFSVTAVTKLGMLLRTALGLSPLDDNIWVENSGRLVPVISGILLPVAQIGALLLAAIAVATLLSEELQREALRVLNVDIEKQRRLRVTTAALLVTCVALQVSPPLPGVDF
eukprot:5380262-Amphidinium_carterae.1